MLTHETEKHKGLTEVPVPSSLYPLLKGEVILNVSKKAKSLGDFLPMIINVKTKKQDAIFMITKQPFYT